MLSDRERRTLRAIERQLVAEDARLAATMSRPISDRWFRWTRRCYDLSILVAVLLAVTCFLLAANGTAWAGATATLFAVVAGYDRWRRFSRHARRR